MMGNMEYAAFCACVQTASHISTTSTNWLLLTLVSGVTVKGEGLLESRLVWQTRQTLLGAMGESSYPLWHFRLPTTGSTALNTDPGIGEGEADIYKTLPSLRNIINWLQWYLGFVSSEKAHLVAEDPDLNTAVFSYMQLNLTWVFCGGWLCSR